MLFAARVSDTEHLYQCELYKPLLVVVPSAVPGELIKLPSLQPRPSSDKKVDYNNLLILNFVNF